MPYSCMRCCVCRSGFWFWDNIVLLTTFALATALVFATTLNTYFQLSIMLMIMVVDLTVLAHASPHREALSQLVQVRFSPLLSSNCCPQPANCLPPCDPYSVVLLQYLWAPLVWHPQEDTPWVAPPTGHPLSETLVGIPCGRPL